MTAPDDILEALRRHLDRSGGGFIIRPFSAIEGEFHTVSLGTTAVRPHAVVCFIDAQVSPFDDATRDRARSVAARLRAPWFAVVSPRQAVLFDTEEVTRRSAEYEQVAYFTRVGEEVEEALSRIVSRVAAGHTAPRQSAHEHLAARASAVTREIMKCTDGSVEQLVAAARITTSVLAYTLVQLRHRDSLDKLVLPHAIRSPRLLLDILGAYFREARQRGFDMFPQRVTDIVVREDRHALFGAQIMDLLVLCDRVGLDRMSEEQLHEAVDEFLRWCSAAMQRPVPSLDVIDLAVRLIASPGMNILEIGATGGLAALRAQLQAETRNEPTPDARVYAASDDDRRLVTMRASGRLDEGSSVTMIEHHAQVKHPWDALVVTLDSIHDRHRLRLLLERMPMSDDARIALFIPLHVLDHPWFADVRTALTSRYRLSWLIWSDIDPFSDPHAGYALLVAHRVLEPGASGAMRSVYVRKPFSSFFLTSESPRERDLSRLRQIDAFIAYLGATERDRANEEIAVRSVSQSWLAQTAREGQWSAVLTPDDVLGRIVAKARGKFVPLAEVADVRSGLRTGANEFFVPDTNEIETLELEPRFWQREGNDGTSIENIAVMNSADIDGIDMPLLSDRRVLLIRGDRRSLDGTNMLAAIERVENDEMHRRVTVRDRDPWYDLGPVRAADLIIPKTGNGRWVIALNTQRAIAGDNCIEIHVKHQPDAEALAAWMNSSVGLFFFELFRQHHAVQDVTVDEIAGFPVPQPGTLKHLRADDGFLRSSVATVAEEFGAAQWPMVTLESIRRDRRRADQWLMENILGLSHEEQRWVYRCALAWFESDGVPNIRALAHALAWDLEQKHRIRPLNAWYSPILDALPDPSKRTLIVPDGLTEATISNDLFSWSVQCRLGSRTEIIECTSQAEAEIIALFIDLGKVHMEIPTAASVTEELLPQLQVFARSLERALDAVTEPLSTPSLRTLVRDELRSVMTRL